VSENDVLYSWADVTPEPDIPIPDVLINLSNNGLCLKSVPFKSAGEKPQLMKNLSVYFSVDTIVASQVILRPLIALGNYEYSKKVIK